MSKKIIMQQVDRRGLLKFLGNSAVMLPFMRTIFETQVFGANNAKRAVFFYYPNGIAPEFWHPTQLDANFVLPVTTAPLQKVRDDILMIGNSDFKTTGSHEAGALYCLTAIKEHGKGISIDTYLGEKFKTGLLPVLRLGVAANFQSGAEKACSFAQPGVPSTVLDNPKKAFEQMFGALPNGFNLVERNPIKAQKSVLDYAIGDIQSLQARLGPIEKTKLQVHLDSLREMERRVNKLEQQQMPGGMPGGNEGGAPVCKKDRDFFGPLKFDDGNEVSHKGENFGLIANIQQELAIQAMACGVTQVVLLQYSHAISEQRMNFSPWNGSQETNHSLSHFSQGAEGHGKNQAYFMQQFANLIEGMKAVKEGDKSLLFNSVLLATSDIGHASNHSMTNVGTAIAGQAGGRIKTGRALDAKGGDHGSTLVTVLQAMGLSDESFGTAKGALPGIL